MTLETKTMYAGIALMVAATILAFCVPARAADDPETTGPDATVTLSNVRCFDATKLDPEAEARAVLMTKTGELWLVLSDPHGLRADTLAFLTVHEGKKYGCMVAESLPAT